VDLWTFLWLMVFLKIPIVGLFLIVRWAIRQTPESATGGEGGVGPRPFHPHRPRSRPPRLPRRGPHREPAPAAPPRMRAVATMRHRKRV
jgi:hypothetical protein